MKRRCRCKVSPSYEEVAEEQHVFRGAHILFFFCSAVTRRGCPSSVRHLLLRCSLLPSATYRKHPAGLKIRGHRINHSPHSPVRAGPHLPQALVPLRYLPCGVVDFLAVVSGSDSCRHPISLFKKIT